MWKALENVIKSKNNARRAVEITKGAIQWCVDGLKMMKGFRSLGFPMDARLA